jgi:enterochelin esterase family protein
MALLWLVLTASSASPASDGFTGFDGFVSQYRAAPAESRQALAQAFITWQQARGGFPIIEADGRVVFFYLGTGQEKDVRLIGEFRPKNFHNLYWDEAGEAMERVDERGGVFFKRFQFEQDARLDYKLVIDGEKKPDPLNPRVIDSGIVGEVSELAMPAYTPPQEALARDGVPKGTLHVVSEAWATPKVTVYLPASYDASKRYRTVYTADGSAWINLVRLPTILDNLIAEGAIEPVIAVLIDPAEDRGSWYQFNSGYLAYLEKVVAYVDSHYPTRARAEDRLHIGTSAGGRITLYVGLERPQLFRNLAMLSPSLAGSPSYYEPYFSRRKRPDPRLRIWLSAGTYEGVIHRDTELMDTYFKSTGLKPKTVYAHQGHSFGAWRYVAGPMLKHFFRAK